MVLHHLFGEFEAKGANEKREYENILGFHVAKKIAAKYEGKILAYDSESGGITISIILPIDKRVS